MPKREREGGREERKQINKEGKKGLSPINSRYMNASSPGYGILPLCSQNPKTYDSTCPAQWVGFQRAGKDPVLGIEPWVRHPRPVVSEGTWPGERAHGLHIDMLDRKSVV